MITKKQIQDLQRLALECPPSERYIYLGDALSYCEQLLCERDAYRQVAIEYYTSYQAEGGSTENSDQCVDAEAKRVMEGKFK